MQVKKRLSAIHFLFMSKKILYLLVFCQLLTISCSKETKLLNKYLESEFRQSIPKEEHWFVFISSRRCSSYGKVDIKDLDANLVANKTTIICRETPIIPDSLIGRYIIRIDSNANFDYMGLPIHNICIIHTNNHRIVKNKTTAPKKPLWRMPPEDAGF